MTKKGLSSVADYRWRLQLTLLSNDIREVLDEVGIICIDVSSGSNRHYLLQNWNDEVEEAVIKKIRQRLHTDSFMACSACYNPATCESLKACRYRS